MPELKSSVAQKCTSSANLVTAKEQPSMVKIISSATSTEKFAIVDGETTIDLTAAMQYRDKRRPESLYYKLPDNSANRHYISADKLVDGLVLEYKESNPTGPRSTIEKHPIEYYVLDEDREVFEQIWNRAKKAKEEAETPRQLTEKEKLELEIAKLQAKIAKLSTIE